MLYFIAERLHTTVTVVECMSVREVQGWLEWFQEAEEQRAAQADGAVDMRTLSKHELRRMFR